MEHPKHFPLGKDVFSLMLHESMFKPVFKFGFFKVPMYIKYRNLKS